MMMESFYEDNMPGVGESLLKKKNMMTLDFNSGAGGRGTKRKLAGQLLSSPDLSLLGLASPELERLIIQQSGMVNTTPTPTQFVFPRSVTEEQEAYARGFVDALEKLHKDKEDDGDDLLEPPQKVLVSSATAGLMGVNFVNIPSSLSSASSHHQLKSVTDSVHAQTLTTSVLPVSSSAFTTCTSLPAALLSSSTNVLLQQQQSARLPTTTTVPVVQQTVKTENQIRGLQRVVPVSSENQIKALQRVVPVSSENQIRALPTTTTVPVVQQTLKTENQIRGLQRVVPVSSENQIRALQRVFPVSTSTVTALPSTVLDVAMKEEPQTVPCMLDDDDNDILPINMETQEVFKLDRKRARNRVAARKCRERKLDRIARLEERVDQLKGQNSDLRNQAQTLREQVSKLKKQIMQHVESGCQVMMGPNTVS